MLQNEDAIRALYLEAQQDKEKMKDLLLRPDSVFSTIGVSIPRDSVKEFKAFLRQHFTQKPSTAITAAAKPSTRCVVCNTSVWALAATVVAVGVAGLSSLTAASPVIVAVASWSGVAPASALAFINSLATSIAAGVASVANEICKWAGYCP